VYRRPLTLEVLESRVLPSTSPAAPLPQNSAQGSQNNSLQQITLLPQNSSGDSQSSSLQQIDHFVIIYQENWSFDSLYGEFPGANGIANATDSSGALLPQYQQVDKNGNPITTLPNPSSDPHVPGGLPAQPYDLSQYVSPDQKTNDIIHRFYHEQLQIGNGALQPGTGDNNKFVTWSDNPNVVLSYFDATNLPEGLLAQQYTLDDNFFHAAYGGSFLNHQFLIAAAAPQWDQPIPAGFQSSWDPTAQTLNDNNLTIDGKYVVNTTFAAQAPHPSNVPANKLLQPINDNNPSAPGYTPTIGDSMDAAGISWKWYSGGWTNALEGNPDPLFQFHHQPFAYYANFAPLNPDGSQNPQTSSLLNPDAHLQDETAFYSDLASGNLPDVSFIKPLGPNNEHPGYTDLLTGQQHVADIVHAVQNSPDWPNTAIIITYDENGGRWDHVAPPTTNDGWGDGTRVPAIVISPYAQRGYVDHNQYDTVSIMKTIEDRYGLQPLNSRDASATSLAGTFQGSGDASLGTAYLQPDADNPGQFALIVGGTEGSDHISITEAATNIRVQMNSPTVTLDNSFSASTISRLEVYSQGGNDHIVIDPSVTIPAFVFTGNGNDHVEVGGGHSVVVGGGGNDHLTGGSAGSILIGGQGISKISAGSAGDILIGGTTTYDANLTALKALLAEWSRTDISNAQKVADIQGAPGGLNGPYALNTSTVFFNGSPDDLRGGAGPDLFFARLTGKKKDHISGFDPTFDTIVSI
jgi:phospholipase C